MNKTIVFTGDSITDCNHMFDAEGLGEGYVRMIQKTLPEDKIVNRGYDGYTASMVSRVWDEICIRYQPDLVTLLVGVNDLSAYLCGGGYGAAGFREQVERILQKTREETDAKIILMEPFLFPWPAEYRNWMEPLADFRRQVRELSKWYETGFVSLCDIFQNAQEQIPAEKLTVDGIHLTELGHGILAEAWMREYGASENV